MCFLLKYDLGKLQLELRNTNHQLLNQTLDIYQICGIQFKSISHSLQFSLLTQQTSIFGFHNNDNDIALIPNHILLLLKLHNIKYQKIQIFIFYIFFPGFESHQGHFPYGIEKPQPKMNTIYIGKFCYTSMGNSKNNLKHQYDD